MGCRSSWPTTLALPSIEGTAKRYPTRHHRHLETKDAAFCCHKEDLRHEQSATHPKRVGVTTHFARIAVNLPPHYRLQTPGSGRSCVATFQTSRLSSKVDKRLEHRSSKLRGPKMYYRNMSIRDIKVYFRSLFEALAAVHKKGVIHRDIKPT